MPLSLKAFTQLRRGLPEDATSEQILAAAKAHEEGTPLEQVWKAVNRPLVGSEDSFFLQHKHADDEGTTRRIAEDLGSSLTAPINLATIAAGGLGSAAGKRAAFGVSNTARGVEAALNAPFIVEGANMALDGDTTGEQLGGAAMAGLGAFGVRQAAKHSFRPKDVRDAFAKTKGLTLDDAPVTPRSDADGMRAADAYAEMPHTPNDPKVASAYKAMSADVEQQYDFLVNKAGVKIEPWTSEGQPYKNSAEMVADVEKNNHLWFFPSESGFGDGAIVDNPLLNKGTNQVVINDMFRAVHDYFGHAVKRNQFGPQGEEIAWREHAKLFNRPGRDAMTSETRGQNSWVNYGPHMRDADGSLLPKGQQPHPSERPYGDQKTGLLAEEFQLTPEERAIAASAPGQSAPAPLAASLDVPSQTPVGSVDAGRIAPNSGVVGTSAELSGSPLILSDELAEQIKANHLQDNGSSTSILNQKTHTPEDGRFMVSPYVGRELALDAPPTAEDLHKFVEVNQDLLNKPGHFLGSWFNKGDKKHYLDVSVGENDLNKTLTLARDSKQMAIFDTKAGREFPTGQYRETSARPGVWERMQSEVGAVGDLDTKKLSDQYGLSVKRGKTFKEDGNYEVTLKDGTVHKIFRDTDQFSYPVWYVDSPEEAGKTYGRVSGFSKNELLEKLAKKFEPKGSGNAGSGTPLALAGPAAAGGAQFVQFSDDPEEDARIRKYMTAVGLGSTFALGTATMFPKPLKVILDKVKKKTLANLKAEGVTGSQSHSTVRVNIRKAIAANVEGDEKRQLLEGLYNTIDLPTFEGINFDTRKLPHKLLTKAADGTPEFKPFSIRRMDKLYEVGAKQGSHWGNPDWVEQLVNGEPELGTQFMRTLGALSPGTPTGWNAAQGAEVFIRHIVEGEPLTTVLSRMKTFGIQNRKSKEMNLTRTSMGGRIYGEKTENLASSELGVKGRIPIDMWLQRAWGSAIDKSPGPVLTRNMEDAFLKFALTKGEDPFTVMAKIWTGMQVVKGKPTPSFKKAFETLGITGDLTDDGYRAWAKDNLKMMSKKLLKPKGQEKYLKRIGRIPAPPVQAPRLVNPNFKRDVETHVLQTQMAGDVLGKKKMTKMDLERLTAILDKAGIAPKTPF